MGEDVDAEILGVAGWQVRAQIAPAYAAGRVFCMGDAVHRHPPTNGLGLNMSIADAYNLGWKLALVLAGRAGAALLDSYSPERQPVGAQGVQRAITSLQEGAAVEAALGYEPGQPAEAGWKALNTLYEPGPAGDERRDALRKAIELSNYQFNAHGIELGYRYRSDAIVDDGSPDPTPARDPQLYYQPTTRPGARVPHARLERDGVPVSSLDLVDDLGFALLTGPGGEAWAGGGGSLRTRGGTRPRPCHRRPGRRDRPLRRVGVTAGGRGHRLCPGAPGPARGVAVHALHRGQRAAASRRARPGARTDRSLTVPEAVIVATARTPIGRAFKGSLKDLRPDDLAAFIIKTALEKVPQLNPEDIDDLMLGCGLPGGEQGFNMARVAAVLLGYDHLPGVTLTRYCASSLQTTRMAFHAIKAVEGDVFISAGVEMVSRYVNGNSDSLSDTMNPVFAGAQARTARAAGDGAGSWSNPREDGAVPDIYMAMGQTAENLALLKGISRAEMDQFGVRSQNLAEKALANGFWAREITPVSLPDGTIVEKTTAPGQG